MLADIERKAFKFLCTFGLVVVTSFQAYDDPFYAKLTKTISGEARE